MPAAKCPKENWFFGNAQLKMLEQRIQKKRKKKAEEMLNSKVACSRRKSKR